MAIHNWVRCHWRNGRHDFQDLPNDWRATLESHLAAQRTRAEDLGVVRVASVDSLAIAWVVCEVPLGGGEFGFTYRRARAAHALVRPLATGGAWDVREAETLLGQRYGEPVAGGLAAQHRALSSLDFPDDSAKALGLFVGREEALPSELVHAPAVAPSDRGVDSDARGQSARTDDRQNAGAAPQIDTTPALEHWIERFTLISRRGATPTAPDQERPVAIAAQGEEAGKLTFEAHGKAEAHDWVRPDRDAEADADCEARDEAEVEAEARTQVEPDARAEVEPDARAEVDPETHAEVDFEPQVQPEAITEVALGADSEGDDDPVPEEVVDPELDREALFDLSTPPRGRVAPPPSSLSGLLGPSHTTAC